MTPEERAALIRTATAREAERNRNARTRKETPAMKDERDYEPEPLRWEGWLIGFAVLVIILLATGVVPVGK